MFNCVYDRDIDEQMRRTRRRALPRHIVSPRAALIFGFVLGIVSTVILWFFVNPLSAVLSVTANAFYVFIYTMLLKRRTTQNIVWGGIAGCFPTLIGWTAVTNDLAWAPIVLFGVVFFWTPPHTWRSRSGTARTTPTSTSRCCRWSSQPAPWLVRSSRTPG